jgi:hypothetical protein
MEIIQKYYLFIVYLLFIQTNFYNLYKIPVLNCYQKWFQTTYSIIITHL